MDIKVTLNPEAIRRLQDAAAKSLTETGDEILSRARNAGVMPMDTGNLQNDSTHVDDSGAAEGHVEIGTDAPYARRLYFNPQYNFRHDKNANARGEWWEPWISGERRDEPPKIFGELLKKNAGGLIK